MTVPSTLFSRRTVLGAAASLAALSTLPARAALRVDITGVGANQIPVAITVNQPADAPQDIGAIVRSDLERSGSFRFVDASQLGPIDNYEKPAILPEVAKLDVNALVAAKVEALGDGRWDVHYYLYDAVSGESLDSARFTGRPTTLRMSAHRISDRVYTQLTGDGPMFASQLAYVAQLGPRRYQLIVADSDGENPQVALESPEPIISPVWSPDGKSLAYVSFERRKAIVYVQSLSTGRRRAVAAYHGNNSAPAWSPDGRRMAVALSRDGLTQIYLIDLATATLKRFTNSYGIDTEPVFTKDGQYIYFTSDRGGAPQIYRQPVAGGRAQRITFGSSYAISPDISFDGQRLAYVSRLEGRFRVAVMDLATGQDVLVTVTDRDESPSFAPNGRFLVYATEENGSGVLGTSSADGRLTTRLTGDGDIREPAWGPIIQ